MMNQQDIFKKIGNILTELNEQYQFLASNHNQLNDLELELFLANADFLADHVRIVQKLNATAEKHAPLVNLPIADADKHLAVSDAHEDEDNREEKQQEEVAVAEENEERVDVQQEQEIFDDEQIHEEVAANILEKDFFKPDQDDHSFEFVLGQHSEDDQFDYEAKSVEEIFDRPLSKAEEEILAQKKKNQEKDQAALPIADEIISGDEDEIGPEPFLISKAEAIETIEPVEILAEPEKTQALNLQQSEPIPALRDVEIDEPVISPPVAEKPIFTPEAVPVRPVNQSVAAPAAPSLNDLLAKTHAQQEEPVKAPIADLKQGISLNEKLLFIKDLFKGYNLAYSEAMDIINKMNSFEAADSFLQSNYALKNDWASKQATVDQFYELLNRRFSRSAGR